MMPRLVYIAIALASLASIGYGCFLIFPPLAFIAVGGLLWLDLNVGTKNGSKPNIRNDRNRR